MLQDAAPRRSRDVQNQQVDLPLPVLAAARVEISTNAALASTQRSRTRQ